MKQFAPILPFRILIADDDEDDVQLTRLCFEDSELHVSLNVVSDGQHLVDHLKNKTKAPHYKELPNLILLDINMPRKGGFEAMAELKADNILCKIPIVIFTTSSAPRDIEKAYELGASCFVNKPDTLNEWSSKLGQLGRFWIECVRVVA